MEKYFKVKTGYDKDAYISITEDELPKALKAQITGQVAVFKEGSVAGNAILTITPDFHRLMGWNKGYQLTSEDYAEIGEETVEAHRLTVQNAMYLARGQEPPKTLSSPEAKRLAGKMKA
jgi:hypothetical protein